ncbi:MAG: glycosyltransferase [Calditrichia bacterium]
MLKKKGWHIGFILHNKKTKKYLPTEFLSFPVSLVQDHIYTLFRSKFSPVHHFPETGLGSAPYFWEFNSLNYQVLRDGYFTPGIAKRRYTGLAKVIQRWKPDILIGDGHLLTYLLGKKMNIPVIQVVRYFVFPEDPQFIWWKEPDSNLIPPESVKVFESLFEEVGEIPPKEGSRLLKGDGYLIPGTEAVEPVKTSVPHLFYGYEAGSFYDDRLLNIDPKNHTKKVYVTIGGGAWKAHIKQYYEFLLDALDQKDFQIIISDPYGVLVETMQGNRWPNVQAFRWIESSTIFPNLDLIIHHGGYGTTMESLWWGVPSIIVPFHTEQEGNGHRLHRLGTGEVLSVAQRPLQTVRFRYNYGHFTMAGGFRFGLTKDFFGTVFDKLMADQGYRENARKMSKELRATWEPTKLLKFLENFC